MAYIVIKQELVRTRTKIGRPKVTDISYNAVAPSWLYGVFFKYAYILSLTFILPCFKNVFLYFNILFLCLCAYLIIIKTHQLFIYDNIYIL